MKTFQQFMSEAKSISMYETPDIIDEALISLIAKGIKQLPKLSHKIKISRMMRQSAHHFDQTTKGWRSLPDERSKEAAIRLFSKKNKPNNNNITWHLGQVQAMRGKNKPAITNMNASKNPRDPQWNRYVNATTSFLNKDRNSFDRAANHPNYNKPTIDRLRQRFNSTYNDAY